MTCTKEELLRQRPFHHFHQICQIPHPSGGEKALSDFIFKWAAEEGLECRQDKVNNVFIRKPASSGYEQSPAVALQAHMDMVCEKVSDSAHDFSKDPISWLIEGDILSTGGETTLGADNGIGVAFAMAILEDKDLKHPELEVLFTVSEESDFTGASSFDISWMKANYLINLDHSCDKEILCGSCGGLAAELLLPLEPKELQAGWETYEIRIDGLSGGHSGEDIHRGHGNANLLLGRVLLALERKIQFGISGISGGSYRLAIPREAYAHISIAPEDFSILKEVIAESEQMFREELIKTQTLLKVSVVPVDRTSYMFVPDSIVTLLLLSPDGICQMNEALEGLVDTSVNLGELHMDDHSFKIVFEIRSAQESLCRYVLDKIERLSRLCGAEMVSGFQYPSWHFRTESALRAIAKETYRELYASEPSVLTVHAGLEVAYFFEKRQSLDAIAIGPDCWNFHSPFEKMSISSAEKAYQFLREIIAKIK